VEEIGGIVSLGGPMSSNDEATHGWIKAELRLLQRALTKELPILGICLGGQLLARALGKRVLKNPVPEVGWFPLELTSAGAQDPIFSTTHEAPTVYHYHFETFELPDGAVCLARSEGCERQAYKLNDWTYGLQFHPEADHQLLTEWSSTDGFEDEIFEIEASYGSRTVQRAKVQLDLAHKAELNSIPLITAFAGLFTTGENEVQNSASIDQNVELWRKLRVPVKLELRPRGKSGIELLGVVERTFQISGQSFLLLRGEDQLVWPVRLRDIAQITPVSK
jgi:GMP synthase (glutamine-hydrolysing)